MDVVEEQEEIMFVKLQRTVLSWEWWGDFSSLCEESDRFCSGLVITHKHPLEALLREAGFNARASKELINFIPAFKKWSS